MSINLENAVSTAKIGKRACVVNKAEGSRSYSEFYFDHRLVATLERFKLTFNTGASYNVSTQRELTIVIREVASQL